MSVLVWDEDGDRLYETGVKKGVLFPYNTSTKQYDSGVAWNGLTSVNEKPTGGDANDQYADDMKYLSLYGTEDFEATIEAFTYPDEFEACDGSAEISTGVYISQQRRIPFGFCYRTVIGNDIDAEDYGYKLHIIYGAKASPSERQYETINDSPDPITFSWDITTTPIQVSGYKPTAHLVINSKKVDATKLATLEGILYGSANADPRLPLPAEIKSIFDAA